MLSTLDDRAALWQHCGMISSPACRSGFPPYCLHVLVALLAALTSAPGVEPAAPKTALPVVNRPTNIVSLFDGKTLDGWKINESLNSWKLKDGEMVMMDGKMMMMKDGKMMEMH